MQSVKFTWGILSWEGAFVPEPFCMACIPAFCVDYFNFIYPDMVELYLSQFQLLTSSGRPRLDIVVSCRGEEGGGDSPVTGIFKEIQGEG